MLRFVLAVALALWLTDARADPRDLHSLALNIYHEARGEPLAGRIAVAEVTIERARQRGTSVHREVWRPKQFSWTANPVRAAGPAWREAKRVAKLVLFNDMAGRRPSVRATHYHAKHVRPYWARGFVKVAAIGGHIFYRAA